MLRGRNRRLKVLPVNSLVPNILTVLALCAGMTAIRFALQQRWGLAVLAIVAAGVFDGLDGRLARLLKGATRFGAELDSLSDFVAFGVAPATVIYLWSTHALGGLGWIASLVFATCCALRLARFNTALDDPRRPPWVNDYFTGVAAPAGAGFAVLPMVLNELTGVPMLREAALCAPWLLVVALLMISRIPTYSLKKLKVRREHVLPTLVLVGVLAAMLLSYPWFMLALVGLCYLVSIPFAMLSHRRRVREFEAAAAREAGATVLPVGGHAAEREDRAQDG